MALSAVFVSFAVGCYNCTVWRYHTTGVALHFNTDRQAGCCTYALRFVELAAVNHCEPATSRSLTMAETNEPGTNRSFPHLRSYWCFKRGQDDLESKLEFFFPGGSEIWMVCL